ncbi:MAG: hypothetical protein ISR65_19880 [Bacteriovoracaceae bacterium]|nr:hypothetical protein [Candidatus Brocadiales bacterium]MBL6992053.1 hypothetical protein [Bacteriovoracaceae bacterium]
MFDQNSKPTISNHTLSVAPIMGVIESPSGDITIISNDSLATTISLSGKELRSAKLFEDAKILSFNEYEDQIWLTTSNEKIYVLASDLSIKSEFNLDEPAVSVAPLEDRSGVVISYFNDDKNESWFEYRGLIGFEVIASGFYGPNLKIVSSVAFHYEGTLYVACCSKKKLCLLKQSGNELLLIHEHSAEGDDMELNFSQLLSKSKRFLIDNLTGVIKTELNPEKYMERICFFRNDEAKHGAIAKRDKWVAFLNPDLLKLINYDTKISYKFDTAYSNPSYVKILQYHVVCAYSSEISIYDFRTNSMKFIVD